MEIKTLSDVDNAIAAIKEDLIKTRRDLNLHEIKMAELLEETRAIEDAIKELGFVKEQVKHGLRWTTKWRLDDESNNV